MTNPKSLVTGGAGFIGSHVVARLLDAGHEVVVMDDLSGGTIYNLPRIGNNLTLFNKSVCDQAAVEHIMSEYKFDYVFHLAAYAAENLSHFIRRYNYNTNLIGSINLINAAVKYKVKRFVFTSSIAVYGHGPTSEIDTPMPSDPYGISKYAVELDLRAAAKMFGLEYTIFRPHNVIGPHQNIGDKYRNVVGIFMNQVMSKQPMTIFGDGNQTRSFTDVEDVVRPIVECIGRTKCVNAIYNIGSDVPYTVNDIAFMVANAFGVEPDIKYLQERQEVKHVYAPHMRANDVFGQTKVNLAASIIRMADWAKEVGPRQSQEFGEIEIQENLPEGW